MAADTMLPRNMRTGGYDLPGVESSEVPLIGYRALSPDSDTNQSGRRNSRDELDTSQVSARLRVYLKTSITESPERVREKERETKLTLCSGVGDFVMLFWL